MLEVDARSLAQLSIVRWRMTRVSCCCRCFPRACSAIPRSHHPDKVTRLFADSRAAEKAHFAKTGIFPIMHALAMRGEQYECNRWLARNLVTAFETAKNNSLERALDITAWHFVLPWVADLAHDAQAVLGEDFWPYGPAANRVTLDTFCQYAFEQGVAHRHVRAEELFVPEVLSQAKV